jgi:hypothetical protein
MYELLFGIAGLAFGIWNDNPWAFWIAALYLIIGFANSK